MITEIQRFLYVAKEGSITRTAEKIFITQSALTQSIQRLEKELGAKLIEQQGKQLQLTDAGKSLVIIGEKIVMLWSSAKNLQLSYHESKYSIGLFDNAALRLSQFLKNAINSKTYSLELVIDNSTSLLTQLKLGSLDAAVCVINSKTKLPQKFRVEQIFTEELIPVSSTKFKGQIETIPFIFYNKTSATREQTDIVFTKHNIVPKVFAESTSPTFMKELAILGSGVALLPKNFIHSEIAQGLLKKQNFKLRWDRTFGLVINKDSELAQNEDLLKKIIKELKKTI